MARIRTIKPSFFTSLTIADLTPEQRLTFIGLWTHVDDDGRCEYDPRLIKAALWPLDDRTVADIHGDIIALEEAGLITHYRLTEDSLRTHGALRERSYLHVSGWYEHQKINRKTDSDLPAPEDCEIVPLSADILPRKPRNDAQNADSLRTHGGLTEDSLPERKGKEGKGREVTRSSAARPKRNPETRAHTIPDNWEPTEKHLERARRDHLNVGVETERFTNNAKAKGLKFKDWDAAFNNWLIKAVEFRDRDNPKTVSADLTPKQVMNAHMYR